MKLRVAAGLIVLLSCSGAVAQTRQLGLDFQLNEPAERLLDEVRGLYGVEPLIVELDSNVAGLFGEATVLPDGQPRVRIADHSPNKLETLVHELFHLKLRHQGFPTIFTPAARSDLQEDWAATIQRLFRDVRDVLAHTMFFADLREIGFDPAEAFSALLENGIASGELRDSMNSVRGRSVLVMRAVLEGYDSRTIDLLKLRFWQYGWTRELATGEELVEIVRAQNPTTPDQLVEVFTTCLDRLMRGRATFRVLRWQEERLSPRFVDRSVVISIELP